MKSRVFFWCVFLLISGVLYPQDKEGGITLNFKDVDIRVVLQTLAEKSGQNIVASPEVTGLVTVQLKNVDWQTALDVILRTYDYGYAKYRGIIIVAPLQKIKEREAQEKEREAVEAPQIRVFRLKYIDANDAKKAITPLLSSRGKVTVLELTGQAGWEFGTDVTKRTRAQEGRVSRTKVLVVSDITRKLDEIEKLLAKIDVMPLQVLIRAKLIEVNRDVLKDIGFDWGTGTQGAETSTVTLIPAAKKNGSATFEAGGHSGVIGLTPSTFSPLEGQDLTPDNTGLKFMLRKLTGSQFEVILRALEEDARTNTLSAPTIITLNNQEASILVGTKYPIVQTQVSEDSSQIIGGSLDKYQDIGIQLNVVPQVCGENDEFINMIIHPAVTSQSGTVSVTSQDNVVLVSYPIITSREAETQIIIKDGETIVMGGLLKDVKKKEEIGVPVLSKLPILGWFFKRHTYDSEKIDLLIFLTAKIIKPGEIIPQELLDLKGVSSEDKGS